MQFADERPTTRRVPWPVPVAGVLAVAAEILWFLFSALMSGLRCDESCDDVNPQRWSDTVDAWQWGALWAVSGIGLIAAVAGVVFALRQRPRAIAISFTVSFAAVVVWGVIYTSG
jgi:hypothetical protein